MEVNGNGASLYKRISDRMTQGQRWNDLPSYKRQKTEFKDWKKQHGIIDAYYNDGVSKYLIKDGDSFKVERRDGKYRHIENLGKISEDEARGKFYYG